MNSCHSIHSRLHGRYVTHPNVTWRTPKRDSLFYSASILLLTFRNSIERHVAYAQSWLDVLELEAELQVASVVNTIFHQFALLLFVSRLIISDK